MQFNEMGHTGVTEHKKCSAMKLVAPGVAPGVTEDAMQ